MTHYDKLIDTISEILYTTWDGGRQGTNWDEHVAKATSHKILEIVEEFQQSRKLTTKPRWRASD